MRKHLELLPPSERSKAMGKLRRAGFTISPSSTASRLAIVVAKALGVAAPTSINEQSSLVKKYAGEPEVASGYGEVKNWVPYVPGADILRACRRAANPYERLPGDGR